MHSPTHPALSSYVLDYDTCPDPQLQQELLRIDDRLRAQLGISDNETAVGVLDLRRLRLAMVNADRIEYAASLPKIAILLAYFQRHPEAEAHLEAKTRHELGLMIKLSDNDIAARYSRELGLKEIQNVLNSYGFYDAQHGGGLWMGKHYGKESERYGDPIADHSHAATVRQLLRFYLLLEQGRLVSPAASQVMREIFSSPDISPLNDKFVKGLAGRERQVLRKAGWWENWFHDSALVSGPRQHYIIVALTHHPRGETYLEEFARAVDDLMR